MRQSPGCSSGVLSWRAHRQGLALASVPEHEREESEYWTPVSTWFSEIYYANTEMRHV